MQTPRITIAANTHTVGKIDQDSQRRKNPFPQLLKLYAATLVFLVLSVASVSDGKLVSSAQAPTPSIEKSLV